MASKNKQSIVRRFLSNDKKHPVLVALAVGLYPLLFLYSNNYTLVNTWSHLFYFILFYLFIPVILFLTVHRLQKLLVFSKWKKYYIPFLNIFGFLFFMMISYYAGFHKKVALIIFLTALVSARFLYMYLNKIIIIQYIFIIIGIFSVVPRIFDHLNYSIEWEKQPDNIEEVIFTKKPNVYFIQPDGYVNFSELKTGLYKYDNSSFENFVEENKFKKYLNFRSNYYSTLTSNSSVFMMKHHYYNNMSNTKEFFNGRNKIISNNSVLEVFKKNNYKTHFLTEMPYLLINRPKMGYDICNFSYDEIPYIGRKGWGRKKNVAEPLAKYINIDANRPKFFFIEVFDPGHIQKENENGVEGERIYWLEKLEESNKKLRELIEIIKRQDANALIVVMSDHGGYVGMPDEQVYEKTIDKNKIYSLFSSILMIHWPNEDAPKYDSMFKSNVNLFRILFSYLSENEKYLDSLQEDESYIIINEGAPKGIYQYIDSDGNINFEKYNGTK
jgi:hypothetical protein